MYSGFERKNLPSLLKSLIHNSILINSICLVLTLVTNGVIETKKADSLIDDRMRIDNESIKKNNEFSMHSRNPNKILLAPRNDQHYRFLKFLIKMRKKITNIGNVPATNTP